MPEPEPKPMEIIEKPIFRTDYDMQLVDSDWLKDAVKPKRFIDFIPEQCILCEGCVDICPWYCIFMVDPQAVEDSGNVDLSRQMSGDDILFLTTHARAAICVSSAAPPERSSNPRSPVGNAGAVLERWALWTRLKRLPRKVS
jgi:ferredoxin